MEITTTIIIPNYNGLKFMDECIRSLNAQTYPNFRTLVVDNGSTDGSVEWLKEHQIDTIFLPENTGFSGAVNVGIKAADTPYVLLLNNDVRVDEYFVAEMVRAIGQSERIFSVSSRMIQMYHPDRLDDAGDMYSLLGWAYQRGVGRDLTHYRRSSRVFSACAGAAIYRREVFEEIGYFDEMHFAYLEDIDVGYRARIFGYENWYVPAALVYHVGSGTSGSRYNQFKTRYSSRNNIYLIYKNMPVLQIILNLPFLVPGFGMKILFFSQKGMGREYVAGIKNGFQISRRNKKVKFHMRNLGRYARIQLELWWNIIYRFMV